jgi:hypothetical protein
MNNETAAVMEILARKQAFMRFQQEILFSFTLYQVDANIRAKCQNPVEWLKECAAEIQSMYEVNHDNRRNTVNKTYSQN